MRKSQVNIAVAFGLLASIFCFAGGAWILFHVNMASKDDAVWTGMGLYFIGKAFFVGPILILQRDNRN